MMQPRKALVLVAWLFIISGASAMVGVVASVVQGGIHNIHIDLNVVGVWIGLGLLRLQPTARRWGIIFLAFSLIVIPAAVFLFGFYHGRPTVTVFGRVIGSTSTSVVVLTILAFGALEPWQFNVLRRADVRGLFDSDAQEAGGA